MIVSAVEGCERGGPHLMWSLATVDLGGGPHLMWSLATVEGWERAPQYNRLGPEEVRHMRHELLTQCGLFCIGVNAKKGTLSQHFVTHVVPPLVSGYSGRLGEGPTSVVVSGYIPGTD